MARNLQGSALAARESLSPATGALLGVLAATCWGLADYFVALITRRIGTLRTLVVMQVASAFAFLFVFRVTSYRAAIPGRDWLIFLLLSVAVVGNYLAFYKALELGPIAIVTPVVAAYAAIVLVLALVLLGERLTPAQGVGAALAIGGVILASADFRRKEESTKRITLGVWLSIVSLIGFGLTSFLAGYYSRRYGWLVPAVPVRIMTTLMFMVLLLSRRTESVRAIGWKLGAWAAVVGVVEAAGFLFFTKAAELGFVAVSASASASYPIIPLILGVTVLRERLAPNQWAGVAAVLVGVLLLAVGT